MKHRLTLPSDPRDHVAALRTPLYNAAAKWFRREAIPPAEPRRNGLDGCMHSPKSQRTGRASLACAAGEEIEMHQQINLNEAPSASGDSLNELFAQHYNESFWIAYRILRSKEDSEDAVQTAFGAAFRGFHRFRAESSFKTWITRIVVNCCLMQLRSRRIRPQVSLDEVACAVASHEATPEALCYIGELREAHARATSELPQDLKDVYEPCLMSGAACPDVAHYLGLTTSAAKSRLFRARKKVEHTLQSEFQRRAA